MKFSEQWLREWVDPPIGTDALAEQLTLAGLEVTAQEPVVGGAMEGVVVGEVCTVAAHPSAGRLRVCTVHIGAESVLSVVCGAPNVRPGLRVSVACVGARLPDGTTIDQTAVRGVASNGMLCSAKELGLAEEATRLLELPADAPIGAAIVDYLTLRDISLDVDLTPNRGDCLSIAGIAREVGVLNRLPVSAPPIDPIPHVLADQFPVSLEAPRDCPRYLGRIIRNIDIEAPTPLWMRERLRRSGLRSLGAVVDVTNYVMLELGQPMHAFDLARLAGCIRVRHARQGETLMLLDGGEVELAPQTLVIADDRAPIALAGVMGGAASAVSATTHDVFLESAFFSPRALANVARRYARHTDSVHRFERGVDPALPGRAIERATVLLLEIVGGEPGPVTEQLSKPDLPRPCTVHLRPERITRMLGTEIAEKQVSEILQQLGMTVTRDGKDWQVTPPSFRFDIEREADLIEELARITGYHAIPCHQPRLSLAIAPRPERQVGLGRRRQTLVERGYYEVITYSFVDPYLQSLMDPHADPMRLVNPISADMAVMRTTLWPGLLQVLLHNAKRQQGRVRVFESGLAFRRENGEVHQQAVLAGLAVGPVYPQQWGFPSRDTDFFDIKSDVEALLHPAAATADIGFKPGAHPALHPGQSAVIERGGRPIGLLGAIHPRIVRELKLGAVPLVFELGLADISERRLPRFEPWSRFPRVRRDIAVIVDESVSAQAVADCVKAAGTELLLDLELFDVYRAEGIDPGKKSLAFGLIFQASSRTLNDEEVDELVAAAVDSLRDQYGAILRS